MRSSAQGASHQILFIKGVAMRTSRSNRCLRLTATLLALLIASPGAAQDGGPIPDPLPDSPEQLKQIIADLQLRQKFAVQHVAKLTHECERFKHEARKAEEERDQAREQFIFEEARFKTFRADLMENYAEAIEKRERRLQAMEAKWVLFNKWVLLKRRLADSPIKLEVRREQLRLEEERLGKDDPQIEKFRREVLRYEAELPGTARQFAELEQELTGAWPLTGEASNLLPPKPEPKPLDPALLERLDDAPRNESKSTDVPPPQEDPLGNPFAEPIE